MSSLRVLKLLRQKCTPLQSAIMNTIHLQITFELTENFEHIKQYNYNTRHWVLLQQIYPFYPVKKLYRHLMKYHMWSHSHKDLKKIDEHISNEE